MWQKSLDERWGSLKFEQKLRWYLVKKFLCSARASTIPPKKNYSLSRKNWNPCLFRVHNLHIYNYQSQNQSKIDSLEYEGLF